MGKNNSTKRCVTQDHIYFSQKIKNKHCLITVTWMREKEEFPNFEWEKCMTRKNKKWR